ncbi:TraB/GumN family protein [Altericroceibacterium endophyticum]|uniref:TraB/GumN family protein n=1 Tax=Altericroceibacterium endophyticum TaxID=1808508 RepID=A0A6I4T265_9SPHN|nr:TraB/GumN family protein [Altericroceibacterium endophyticum]MXO64432.1 TraB/GumN family protein [Altericroceibacterium endophyticum]
MRDLLQMRIALSFFLIACLLACQRSADQEWPNPAPALWEVHNADGQLEGWLFGTVHALPDGVEWRTPRLDSALAQTEKLVVEVADLNDSSAIADEFARLSRSDRPLPPLEERVPQQDRAAITRLITQAGSSDASWTHVKSWGAALILANATRQNSDSSNGVDRWLLRQHPDAMELEGAAQQFHMFDNMSRAEQSHLLISVAQEAAAAPALRDASLKAWLTGDLRVLKNQSSQGLLANPQLRETLLTKRNRNWVDKLDTAFPTFGPLFIAVGAGHMIGADGLPQALSKEGYVIKRIQ